MKPRLIIAALVIVAAACFVVATVEAANLRQPDPLPQPQVVRTVMPEDLDR